jgi:hypothetical protein
MIGEVCAKGEDDPVYKLSHMLRPSLFWGAITIISP